MLFLRKAGGRIGWLQGMFLERKRLASLRFGPDCVQNVDCRPVSGRPQERVIRRGGNAKTSEQKLLGDLAFRVTKLIGNGRTFCRDSGASGSKMAAPIRRHTI